MVQFERSRLVVMLLMQLTDYPSGGDTSHTCSSGTVYFYISIIKTSLLLGDFLVDSLVGCLLYLCSHCHNIYND